MWAKIGFQGLLHTSTAQCVMLDGNAKMRGTSFTRLVLSVIGYMTPFLTFSNVLTKHGKPRSLQESTVKDLTLIRCQPKVSTMSSSTGGHNSRACFSQLPVANMSPGMPLHTMPKMTPLVHFAMLLMVRNIGCFIARDCRISVRNTVKLSAGSCHNLKVFYILG